MMTMGGHAASFSASTGNGGGGGGGSVGGVASTGRIPVPRLNSLRCVGPQHAVAFSRSTVMLLSEAAGRRYNTQSLATLPVVINDMVLLRATDTAVPERFASAAASGGGDSALRAHFARVGATMVLVASDRSLTLVNVSAVAN